MLIYSKPLIIIWLSSDFEFDIPTLEFFIYLNLNTTIKVSFFLMSEIAT